MHFATITNRKFAALKAEIERCSRLRGYYLIDMVAIPGLPKDEVERDFFLDHLFQYFDDQEWPPPSERPTDQTWDEYEVDRDEATAHVVEALIGGGSIGHTIDTMSLTTALELWHRFESLLAEPRHYYIRMGLGNQRFVFQHGAVVVGSDTAGLLWIAESD